MPLSKDDIRNRARAALAAQDTALRRSRSLAACARMRSQMYWRDARSILAYLSFGEEMDTDPLIEAALDEGRWVFVPRIVENRILFHRLNALDDPLETNHFGIREPHPGTAIWTPLSAPGPALAVAPGMAFDGAGRRLGRGGGFYDRFIGRERQEARVSGEKPPLFIGYGFDFQVIDEVPVNPDDEWLDGWVTEARTCER